MDAPLRVYVPPIFFFFLDGVTFISKYDPNDNKAAKDQARQKSRTESWIKRRAAVVAEQARKDAEAVLEREKQAWWSQQRKNQESASQAKSGPGKDNYRPPGDIKRDDDQNLRDFWNRKNRNPGREPD